uniref:Uncharacterized protein n=1 Tax=Glossina austeni TaxID=7395 RepID=A0A1A9UJP5_GLOAU
MSLLGEVQALQAVYTSAVRQQAVLVKGDNKTIEKNAKLAVIFAKYFLLWNVNESSINRTLNKIKKLTVVNTNFLKPVLSKRVCITNQEPFISNYKRLRSVYIATLTQNFTVKCIIKLVYNTRGYPVSIRVTLTNLKNIREKISRFGFKFVCCWNCKVKAYSWYQRAKN